MDTARRRMAGRWAEWVGPSGVPADTLARRLGVAAACRRDLEVANPETRRMLEAYAAGVNAQLAGLDRLPMEYGLLGVEPEAWEPEHSIAAMRQRGYLMGSVWFKLWRAAAVRAIGPDRVGLLRYDDGDPHRAFEMPGMYTQAHLACDSFDAIGLTVPGVPGFPHFAHNGSVAWSVTHAFTDIHDLYVDLFSPDAGSYRFRDEWRPTSVRTERVLVAGADPVDVQVVETHHGPVVAGDPAQGAALTLRSMQFAEVDRSFDCLLPMVRARTADELFDACAGWGLIDHNLVAADTAGSIGHLVRAVVPRRPRLNGWLPVPGWTGEHDWDGMIPFAAMPRTSDPARGYLATANNRVVADTADGGWRRGWPSCRRPRPRTCGRSPRTCRA
jgi:acyl-homoserine lactone acylase PvdQ